MSRRAVLATLTATVLLGGAAAPALADTLLGDPTTVCVLTHYDPKTGAREGFCVWVPVEPPLSADAAR